MAQNENNSILIETYEHMRIITINRPHIRNALNQATLMLLISAIKQADADPTLRALVITGSGEKAFCAGADLGAIIEEEGSVDGISAFGDLFLTMNDVGIPIIAAVNGVAVGGGLGIMLASDLVVMAETARVGAPEVSRGLFAMFISRYVYQTFPEKVANRMLLLGEMLDAKSLLQLNVVNFLVRDADLRSEAISLAQKLCAHSGSVMRLGKRAIRRQRDFEFEGAMSFLGEELKKNLRLSDSREGIEAFLNKRRPLWSDL